MVHDSRLRVFVAYSHEDRELVRRLVEVLEERFGLRVLWDDTIWPGWRFTDAIKSLIMNAHLFMPLLTENSQSRPWVHQETGYAMALGIPVLPVAVNTIPKEMLATLEAITVDSDFSNLEKVLAAVDFEKTVLAPVDEPASIVEVAEWPETRTQKMVDYTKRIADLDGDGCVRQRAVMSSFCIPDRDIHDPIWDMQDAQPPRSLYYRHLLREERRSLERHARSCGVYLIIDPSIETVHLSEDAKEARLRTLLSFLQSMPDEKAHVVISQRARRGNLTIVGDWFVAESRVPRPGGFEQTVFSRHAPTALRAVRRFDQDFEELSGESGLAPDESRQAAIAWIKQR